MSHALPDRRLVDAGAVQVTDREFAQFRRFLHGTTGIALAGHKKALVAGRLMHRLRQLGLSSYQAYFEFATQGGDGAERQTLIDLLTTNETYFYREPKHFEFLRASVLPEARRAASFRVWSAASSSGEEAYTLAFELAEALGLNAAWDILASDISSRVLERAQAACYSMSSAERIPPALLQKYCLRGIGKASGVFRVEPALRRHVTFRPVNLVQALPALGPFDVIFVRNVMIYFDTETRRGVVERLLTQLRSGGYLFISHAESLNGVCDGLDAIRPSIYRKP